MLKAGEMKPRGYEYKSVICGWIEGKAVGQRVRADGLPCRVRVAPRAIKAIATRATVRAVSVNGAAWVAVVRNDSGLKPSHMEFARAIFDKAVDDARNRSRVPKYIMLEIQRGPNDY